MNLENVHFLGLCRLITLQCSVQKTYKIIIGLIATKLRHLSKFYCFYLE